MNSDPPAPPTGLKARSTTLTSEWGKLPPPVRRIALFAAVLTIGFAIPLYRLVRYSLATELHSHALLIPLVSLYLLWLMARKSEPGEKWHLSDSTVHGRAYAFAPLLLGLVALGVYWVLLLMGHALAPNDSLAFTTLAFVSFLAAGGFLFLGSPAMRRLAFPLAFLVFMVPLPTFLENWIEMFFQYASAEAAHLMLGLTSTSMIREGLQFRLPGISMQVAEECSGIRSSLVLFITSLLAGYLFLRCPGRRAVLALAIVPLGILRNGFRIFTIGMLCVQVDPQLINSALHRRGGPLFFVYSLAPLFFLLLWLRKTERHTRTEPEVEAVDPVTEKQ